MRPEWHEYFFSIVEAVAERSTCDRAKVGALIVKDKRILATGYNGSIMGLPHCDEAGHEMIEGHCVRTVHAEMNALAQAARYGVSVNDASIYVSMMPCLNCFKVLANAGIKNIYYKEDYVGSGSHSEQTKIALNWAAEAGIAMKSLKELQ